MLRMRAPMGDSSAASHPAHNNSSEREVRICKCFTEVLGTYVRFLVLPKLIAVVMIA